MATLPTGRLAIFPGSFDPLTNGHVDVVLRCAALFERVLVAVLVNPDKKPLFTPAERVTMIGQVFAEHPNVGVDTFDGLLVEYARTQGASAIVRGIRSVSDFDFEFQMALMNRRIEPTLETVFMVPSEQYTYLSSRLIKEVFSLGGAVAGLVPETVEQWMTLRRARGEAEQNQGTSPGHAQGHPGPSTRSGSPRAQPRGEHDRDETRKKEQQ
jgi:pantetheine-phosphate adenylyltransferase